MRKHRPNRNRLGGSKRNTSGTGRCSIWRRGTCIVESSLGRCEKKTGIKPFGLLVDQVLEQDPYKDATQLFFIVDNGSSHRGQASVERMRRRDKRIVLVHTPIHASWLNQVEIYFSIIQRKVLTPNDFAKLEAIRVRLALYEELSNRTPKPFAWKFTRQDMLNWLKRASPHFLAASAA